jgi:hypothetical protein
VQRTREHLLADAGLAQQQHGDLARRRGLEQGVGGGEAGGAADHVGRQRVLAGDRGSQLHDLGLQVDQLVGDGLGPEVAHVRGGIVPFLDRLADDAAVAVPHADTFDFLVQDRPAHEGRGVAAGIADLRPAHRLGMDAVMVAMPLAFPGVFPQELAVEAGAGTVELDAHRRHAHDAFQRVQLRPGHEGLEVAAVLGPRACQFGVAQPRGVAHAGEQAACAVHAQRVDQLLAQQRLGLGVHEQHAVFVQPDLPGLGAEVHTRAQVFGSRLGDAVQLGDRDRHGRSLPARGRCWPGVVATRPRPGKGTLLVP